MKRVNHDLYPISKVQKHHPYALRQHILFIGHCSSQGNKKTQVKGDEICSKTFIH